jgi:ribosomal protein L2
MKNYNQLTDLDKRLFAGNFANAIKDKTLNQLRNNEVEGIHFEPRSPASYNFVFFNAKFYGVEAVVEVEYDDEDAADICLVEADHSKLIIAEITLPWAFNGRASDIDDAKIHVVERRND